MSSREAPENWDPGVEYITQPTYTTFVTADLQKLLHTPATTTASWPKVSATDSATPNARVRIRFIDDEAHPAFGQRALVATEHLPPSSHIITYLGVVHSNDLSDTDPQSDYDLSLDRELGLSVDASKVGNEARFINDYRGVADGPNAEFRDCWVQMPAAAAGRVRAGWERRIGVFVLGEGKAKKRSRGICPGEEILVNYGRSFWSQRKAEEDESAAAGT